MSTAIFEPISTLPRNASLCTELTATPQGQLVGRQSTDLTTRLEPLVHDSDVALDMSSVKRIDAAGIAALVALYRSARDAGHHFTLTNVPARVAQILAVVGLDGLLVSHNAVRNAQSAARRQRSAA